MSFSRGTIIKASPDMDLYVIWSNGVDAPTWVGTRTYLLKGLQRDWNRQHPDCLPKPGKAPEDRIMRADETGTSSYDLEYGWNDTGMIYMQRGWLRRDRLAEAMTRFLAYNDDIDDLLEPFDGEDAVRPA